MDDGRLASEMTLEGISAQLKELKNTVTETNVSVTDLKASVSSLDRRMTAGFTRVDEELNASKVRDEELRGLMKFSLEANVALRESMETRFAAVDKKQDEEIGLVKDVIRDLSAR